MTETNAIPHVTGRDINVTMNPGSEKRQGMRGFDADYVDIVDYIVRCTHKIWEEKQVGLIYTHYAYNALVHGTRGDSYGVESVVAGTVQTLAMFPDRRLFADDVIWSGDDETGYYTSHRITSTAHHRGLRRLRRAHGPQAALPRHRRLRRQREPHHRGVAGARRAEHRPPARPGRSRAGPGDRRGLGCAPWL